MLLEIVAVATAVDAEEVGIGTDRGQHAVPGVHCDVHALTGTGEEGARCAWGSRLVGRDHDQKRMPGQRVERLAAQRVAFNERQGVGQGEAA